MKLQSIQLLRAIACVMVVIYHLSGLSIDYTDSLYFDHAFSVLKIGVDIFFVISGVVMVITTAHRFDEREIAVRFAIHRFARIYPPYWILSIILTCYWYYTPGSINAQHGGLDFLASYTLFPSKCLPIVPVAWTLSYEVMFYLVYGLMLATVPAERLPFALVTWAIVVGFGTTILLIAPSDGVLVPFLTSPFVLEFVAGCGIGLLYMNRRIFAPQLCILTSLVGIVMTATAFHYYAIPDSIATSARVAIFGPLAILFVYGGMGLETHGIVEKLPRWAVMIGDSSYSLYLIHILVIHGVYRIFRTQMIAVPDFGVALLVGTLGFCIAIGYGYWRWIECPSFAFCRRLLENVLVPVAR